MRADDILRFVWVADPQFSPDGRRVTFTHVSVAAEADEPRTALWLLDLDADGQPLAAPRPLTSGPRDSQPRWSPDGALVAFVRAAEAGKPGQLCVLRMAGGGAEKLTQLE